MLQENDSGKELTGHVSRRPGVGGSAGQMKWAVLVAMRDNPPGSMSLPAARFDPLRFDLGIALGALAWDIWRGTAQERLTAAEALGWLHDARGVAPLLRGITDVDYAVRNEAAYALARFGRLPDWAMRPLAHAMRRERFGLRISLIWAISAIRTVPAAELVLRTLRDDESTVRLTAAMGVLRLVRRGAFDPVWSLRLKRELESECDRDVALVIYSALRECADGVRWPERQRELRDWEHPDNWRFAGWDVP